MWFSRKEQEPSKNMFSRIKVRGKIGLLNSLESQGFLNVNSSEVRIMEMILILLK